jgi:hypothetical protein
MTCLYLHSPPLSSNVFMQSIMHDRLLPHGQVPSAFLHNYYNIENLREAGCKTRVLSSQNRTVGEYAVHPKFCAVPPFLCAVFPLILDIMSHFWIKLWNQNCPGYRVTLSGTSFMGMGVNKGVKRVPHPKYHSGKFSREKNFTIWEPPTIVFDLH